MKNMAAVSSVLFLVDGELVIEISGNALGHDMRQRLRRYFSGRRQIGMTWSRHIDERFGPQCCGADHDWAGSSVLVLHNA